mmetsp:Transcript_3402/g.5942  ORF Transcript_3402/g.5942 Transcript_3402/m.5942 type:complete len:321 (-) Transcript_3402:1053-2015(-)
MRVARALQTVSTNDSGRITRKFALAKRSVHLDLLIRDISFLQKPASKRECPHFRQRPPRIGFAQPRAQHHHSDALRAGDRHVEAPHVQHKRKRVAAAAAAATAATMGGGGGGGGGWRHLIYCVSTAVAAATNAAAAVVAAKRGARERDDHYGGFLPLELVHRANPRGGPQRGRQELHLHVEGRHHQNVVHRQWAPLSAANSLEPRFAWVEEFLHQRRHGLHLVHRAHLVDMVACSQGGCCCCCCCCCYCWVVTTTADTTSTAARGRGGRLVLLLLVRVQHRHHAHATALVHQPSRRGAEKDEAPCRSGGVAAQASVVDLV